MGLFALNFFCEGHFVNFPRLVGTAVLKIEMFVCWEAVWFLGFFVLWLCFYFLFSVWAFIFGRSFSFFGDVGLWFFFFGVFFCRF